jgi:hypothetical protein
MELSSVWNRMIKGGPDRAEAEPQEDYKKHPGYADAQKRSMSYYGKHGESRPLKDFINDPSLK